MLRSWLASVRRTLWPRPSMSEAKIDAMYADKPDPWGLTTSPYEAAKYDDTLASLPKARYARGVEIGCSVGVLSQRLAARCDTLVGVDLSEPGLEAARLRNATNANTTFVLRKLPDTVPEGTFDLIVFSEVLYFFSTRDLARVAAWVCTALRPGGDVVLVNYLGSLGGYPMTGTGARAAFIAGIAPVARLVTDLPRKEYRIDVLHRST